MSYKQLKNNLAKTGHYIGLKFSDGWFFAHVLDTEYIELKPWILYNQDGERGELEPGEVGLPKDNEVEDLSERDLIVPRENERDLMYQVFMGVSPSRLRVFPYYGRNNRPNLVGGAEPENAQTPLTGYDTPYNAPTRQSEFFTLNDIPDLSFQPHNPTSEAVEPRVSFHVNKFRYAAIEDEQLMKSFIQGQTNFRDHSIGLGARQNEQEPAPGWLKSRFSDVILTTEEIMEFTGESSGGD